MPRLIFFGAKLCTAKHFVNVECRMKNKVTSLSSPDRGQKLGRGTDEDDDAMNGR